MIAIKSIDEIQDESLDTIFLFHVFEHLPNPRKILTKLKKLRIGGHLILEVPQSMDFLVSILSEESFINWYFWSSTFNSTYISISENIFRRC